MFRYCSLKTATLAPAPRTTCVIAMGLRPFDARLELVRRADAVKHTKKTLPVDLPLGSTPNLFVPPSSTSDIYSRRQSRREQRSEKWNLGLTRKNNNATACECTYRLPCTVESRGSADAGVETTKWAIDGVLRSVPTVHPSHRCQRQNLPTKTQKRGDLPLRDSTKTKT